MADLLSVPGLVETRHEYAHVFGIYVPIALGVFALIVLLVMFAVLRYRRRPPEQAARWHEHNPLEASYAVLLSVVVAFLLYMTFTAEHRVDTVANRERASLTIDVVAAKWEWTFTYPAYGITQRSGTAGHQPLVVPVGEPIRFNFSTLDVIHAFWVPELRYKHDLTPGATQSQILSFSRPGVFPGECAEFCGLRHADMLFSVHAVPAAEFARWASTRGPGRTP